MLPQLEYSGVLEMWIISSEFQSEIFGEIQVCLKQHLLVMMVLYKHGGGVQMKKATACTLFMVKLAEESGKNPVILLYFLLHSANSVSFWEEWRQKQGLFLHHITQQGCFLIITCTLNNPFPSIDSTLCFIIWADFAEKLKQAMHWLQ